MPLMKGHSPRVVSGNIREMMKAGHPQKQAIAASLANARKYRKMNQGGMMGYAEGGEVQSLEHGGMEDMEPELKDMEFHGGKNESMAEMAETGDFNRGLNEINEEGRDHPDQVANPSEMEEAQSFAAALRKQAMGMNSVHNYAMGGLVQDGPAEDEKLHGTQPELDWVDDGMEDKDMLPQKPGMVGDTMNQMPSGPELSIEAKKALAAKKKMRMYGKYDPKA